MRAHSLRLEIAFWAACFTLAAAFAALAVSASRYYESAIDEKVTFAVQGLYTRSWADALFETAQRFGEFWPLVGAAAVLVLALLARRQVIEAAVVIAAMVPPMLLAATNASVERPDEIYNAMRGTFDGLQYPRIYRARRAFERSVFGEVLVYGLIFMLVSRVTSSWPAIALVRIGCAAVIAVGSSRRCTRISLVYRLPGWRDSWRARPAHFMARAVCPPSRTRTRAPRGSRRCATCAACSALSG